MMTQVSRRAISVSDAVLAAGIGHKAKDSFRVFREVVAFRLETDCSLDMLLQFCIAATLTHYVPQGITVVLSKAGIQDTVGGEANPVAGSAKVL